MISFENLFFGVTLFAALGCGLMAGLFFVFSVAVMKALASLPPAQGNAAMQAINVAILNPWFGLVFLAPPSLRSSWLSCPSGAGKRLARFTPSAAACSI